jgi:hypothetical protein
MMAEGVRLVRRACPFEPAPIPTIPKVHRPA